MEKFQNKYRIESTRLRNWDYGWNGAYFITICTQDREHYFSDIVDSRMVVFQIGEIAQSCWMEIPQHFPFVRLDAFVVMPNHIHGIVIIDKIGDKSKQNHNGDNVMDWNDANVKNDANNLNGETVKTQNFASLQHSTQHSTPKTYPNTTPNFPLNPQLSPKPPSLNKFGPQSQNLASIIRGYKTGVTKLAKTIKPSFGWQPRFYEHIIRNDNEFDLIKYYIINNPVNWDKDKFH